MGRNWHLCSGKYLPGPKSVLFAVCIIRLATSHVEGWKMEDERWKIKGLIFECREALCIYGNWLHPVTHLDTHYLLNPHYCSRMYMPWHSFWHRNGFHNLHSVSRNAAPNLQVVLSQHVICLCPTLLNSDKFALGQYSTISWMIYVWKSAYDHECGSNFWCDKRGSE